MRCSSPGSLCKQEGQKVNWAWQMLNTRDMLPSPLLLAGARPHVSWLCAHRWRPCSASQMLQQAEGLHTEIAVESVKALPATQHWRAQDSLDTQCRSA